MNNMKEIRGKTQRKAIGKTYLGERGLFGGCWSLNSWFREGERGGVLRLGSNKSIGGVSQSSHDCCWILGALGLAGGLREQAITILPRDDYSYKCTFFLSIDYYFL